MGPGGEDVIQEPPQYSWFSGLSVEKTLFPPGHEQVGICWGHLCARLCRSMSLVKELVVKSKHIVPDDHLDQESNNFRWLNADEIVFFVRDNSGEKFLTTHAARRNFSEVICRACAAVVHSWFSHLHGKFCVLALRTWCFGVAAIKNHTPPNSCVVWSCRVRKHIFRWWVTHRTSVNH